MTTSIVMTDETMTDDFNQPDDPFSPLLNPTDERAEPDMYPRMRNLSAAFAYRGVVRALDPAPPEYVTVPLSVGMMGDPRPAVAVAQWNLLWESAQFRRRYFGEEDLPAPLSKVADRGDLNVVFVPRTRSRYYEYAPLFHLLPRAAVARHGLPLLGPGIWPFSVQADDIDTYLPADFQARLSRAWAGTVWRHLMPQYQSPISGFTANDPIRILAQNLDFWIPPITAVTQDVLRDFPEVNNGITPEPVRLQDGSLLEGAVAANPRTGGDIWQGEEEAAEVVRQTVEAADADGRLRGILDAVRSHRCEDDFSSRWTGAREDFERKLYNKRSKVKVRFVELTDTIPVHGPETEVVGQMLCGDFLALLDERDRTVVVLLNSGVTKLTEVAALMGYRNHSAVSKRLDKIRQQAARFFN
ncbi:sigma-70 family RNA polymerase sigma factor [Micromonospora echinofusca]|uniref:sigma-70 family RNA polymerase sigma factor n=1 Tax=Micromonospora echinofusca TaxID=47858 RepID=UPI0033EAC452